MKKNSEDEESTNKPQLNCLKEKEYLIELVTDELDSTFVYQLIKLNILRQKKVVVQSSRRP